MRNKRGQVALTIVSALIIFLIGMAVINIIKPEITTARAVGALNCGNAAAISDGTKVLCLFVDFTLPYFILIILSASGGIILSRIIK